MEFLPWRATASAVETYLGAASNRAEKQGFAPRATKELGLLRASDLWRELRSARWTIYSELSVVAPLEKAGWVDGVIDLVAQDNAAGETLVIDWKTNHLRAGESGQELLDRLVDEYRPQLQAYGTCLRQFFPHQTIKLGVYASGIGGWRSF
jgi:ATP-dependent exoDNAse (exonuclease V) beta subunit